MADQTRRPVAPLDGADERFHRRQIAEVANAAHKYRLNADGSVERYRDDKLSDTISVKDFGADPTGATDSTAAFQAGAAAVQTLGVPEGTYLVDNWTPPSGLKLKGEGPTRSILKRPNSSANNAMVLFTTKNGVTLEGLGFDGNKANQSVGAHNVIFQTSCYNITVKDCHFYNAKRVGSSWGTGLSFDGGADQGNKTVSRFLDNEFYSNDGNGLSCGDGWNYVIDRNHARENGVNGIGCSNVTYPVETDSIRFVQMTNNHAQHNDSAGITMLGFTAGASSSVAQPQPTDATRSIAVSGNICQFNGTYGLVFQGSGGSVSNNVCSNNGTADSPHAGILGNSKGTVFIGNVMDENTLFGMDAGGSQYCSFIGNSFKINGGDTRNPTDKDGIGLSVGGCVDCVVVGNFFRQNGGTDAGSQIYVPRFEVSGGIGFDYEARNIHIADNQMYVTNASTHYGIRFIEDPKKCRVIDNTAFGGIDSDRAFSCASTDVEIRGNRRIGADTLDEFPVASASAVVLPDWVERVDVTGTTGITSIRSFSQDFHNEKIFAIHMTNNGTGYTSAPTVSLSGGGGSGASLTAIMTNDGRVAYVRVTAQGSGYTSVPTVSFSGGGGSGAAATAEVGCANQWNGHDLELIFNASLTVTNGNNLNLASASNFSATANDMLCLQGRKGELYEKSRSVN